MVSSSLIKDFENCLSKGEESWKDYFSRWEGLAKEEEEIPEEDLLFAEENEEIQSKKTRKKPNKRSPQKKKFKKLPNSKKVSKDKKRKRKVLIENKIQKKDKNKKIIERPMKKGNENLPEEADNEQLELDLRTVIVNILKANKNKWEIFSVLSQTFSNGEVAIKSSTLVLNQPPAISFNDDRIIGRSIFSSGVPKSNGNSFWGVGNSRYEDTGTRKLNLGNFSSNFIQQENFNFGRLCRKESNSALIRYNSFPQQNSFFNNSYSSQNNTFDFTQLRYKTVDLNPNYLPYNVIQTPPQNLNLEYQNRVFRSCPSTKFSYGNRHFQRPLALEFRNGWKTEERNKINNEFFRSGFQHDFDVNTSREKSSQNLCLHKRTNDISLNMENSNFITPKRKLPERKCLSENILQRKRKRPSKLSLFDNEDESESDDDQTQKRSHLIQRENKKRKFEKDLEIIEIKDSDSSDDESIFDKPKKN